MLPPKYLYNLGYTEKNRIAIFLDDLYSPSSHPLMLSLLSSSGGVPLLIFVQFLWPDAGVLVSLLVCVSRISHLVWYWFGVLFFAVVVGHKTGDTHGCIWFLRQSNENILY